MEAQVFWEGTGDSPSHKGADLAGSSRDAVARGADVCGEHLTRQKPCGGVGAELACNNSKALSSANKAGEAAQHSRDYNSSQECSSKLQSMHRLHVDVCL